MLKSHLVWLLPNHRLVQTRRSRVKMKFHKLLRDLDLESLQYKQISELSGGQLQRVLVARALMSDSTIYLLTNHLLASTLIVNNSLWKSFNI